MSIRATTLKLAAALAGLLTLSQPAHAVVGLNGVALPAGQDCAMQYYQHNMNGPMLVKAAGALAGRYELRVARHNAANQVLADLSGTFSGGHWQDTVLTRASFLSTDFVRGRIGGVDEYLIDAELRVYDTRGRLVCRSTEVEIRPLSQIAGSVSPTRLELVPEHEAEVEPDRRAPQLLPQYRNRQPLSWGRRH
ncbi:hypothetical protein [Maricaulis maris]|uniref:FlgO domain-containing protein n=1 Tax=Maricaulis maris TaxID=74318 RepID=A0A495DDL3_9PROT|nr:hypothetical protein [Maricaulis maris]RKR00398.1 hypothetical protein C7435_1606 [Maricaulis maris]